MHYHLIGLSVSLCCSAADLLLRRIPFAAGPVSGLTPTSNLAGHPPQLLMPFACLYCQAPPLSWISPCEVVVVLVRYVSFSSMSGGSVLGVCLGSGGSRSPCSRVPLFSKHRREGLPLGGSRFQGCHGYLPFALWLLLPANLYGTSSQAHQFVMSLNVGK